MQMFEIKTAVQFSLSQQLELYQQVECFCDRPHNYLPLTCEQLSGNIFNGSIFILFVIYVSNVLYVSVVLLIQS